MPASVSRHFDPVSLRLFVAVCESGNIARAAEREALVASAVSKRISAIEAQVGTPLLRRGRRGIEPTPAGQALWRRARELLDAMDRLHAELGEFAAGVQGSVRVLASVSALAEWLPDDVASFVERHPTLRVSLDEQSSPEIVKSVREGRADLGVVWDALDLGELSATAYRSDRLCVVVPSEHPLARRRRVRLIDTLEHASVGVSQGGLMDLLLHRQAALLGRSLTHRVQVSSLEAGCRIVAAGLGLAILPREAVQPQLSVLPLVAKPLDEPWARRRFVVLAREEALLSHGARLLLAHLRKVGAKSAPTDATAA